MSELVYKKGEGWVYPAGIFFELLNDDSIQLRFEEKEPRQGDYVLYIHKTDTYFFNADGSLNQGRFLEAFQIHNLRDYTKIVDLVEQLHHYSTANWRYLVVTEV